MRMNTTLAAIGLLAGALLCGAAGAQSDPRLREIWYDPEAVVSVPVKRGVVTHLMLDAGETISDVASGMGADCTKPDMSWCIAMQAGSRHIFVKPKSTASGPNNLAVVTDRRTHSFRFEVLDEGDRRAPVYRLHVKAAPVRVAAVPVVPAPAMAAIPVQPEAPAMSADEVIAGRLTAAPAPVNSSYALAEGKASEDIVPTLVFDDGRFTYLKFPNNREVPAVFHVLRDGSETLVNARMEGDLLVIDRVSRRLSLRAGSAVVGIWNEGFDADGVPPNGGTTVAGVERTTKASPGSVEQQGQP
jgi:type IV secretion system protein VirB9